MRCQNQNLTVSYVLWEWNANYQYFQATLLLSSTIMWNFRSVSYLPLKPYFEEKSFMNQPVRKRFLLSLCWRKNVVNKKYSYHTTIFSNLRLNWYRPTVIVILILDIHTYIHRTYLHCSSYSTWFGQSLKSIYICWN